MKKFFAFLLTATLLVTMFAVAPSAATIDYVITGVDVPVEEAGVVVCTSLEKFGECNPNWSNCLQLTPNGDGYRVVGEVACPAEKVSGDVTPAALIEATGFTKNDGDIYVILHGKYDVGYNMDVELDNLAVGGTLSFSGTKLKAPNTVKLRVDNNVAYKKGYTTSNPYRDGGREANWGYSETAPITYPDDNNKELTDRLLPGSNEYTNSAFVGLHDGTPDTAELGYAWVKVDLEKEYDITEVRAYMPNLMDGGVGPANVTFIGYDADGNATELGTVLKEDVVAADTYCYAALEVEATVEKVEFRLARGGWCFITEVVVIAAEEKAPEASEPEVEEPVQPEEPTTNIEELLGDANADAAFDAVVTIDPSNYVAGEKITVNVSINNITAENGLDTVELVLNYDETKLELAEELAGSAIKVFNGFAEWEDLSKVEDGVIALVAGTAGGENGDTFTYAKNDGEITFSVEFTVKADATGDIAAWIPHNTVFGYYTDGGNDYVGNGSGMAITAATGNVDDSTSDSSNDQPKPGDATSMIFFAIIALVAIAGSAVVIKTRK